MGVWVGVCVLCKKCEDDEGEREGGGGRQQAEYGREGGSEEEETFDCREREGGRGRGRGSGRGRGRGTASEAQSARCLRTREGGEGGGCTLRRVCYTLVQRQRVAVWASIPPPHPPSQPPAENSGEA